MKPVVIFIIIFLLLIGVGIGLLYYFYEKPLENQMENSYVNFNVYSKDGEEQIVTGYKILINGILYSEGLTDLNGGVLEQIPANYSSIEIYNYNLENQHYYTTTIDKESFNTEPQKIILKLEKPGKLNITQSGKLDGNLITLNISSYEGKYRKPKVCLKYSIHIITVQTNFPLISNIENYSNYDKCYDLGEVIDENNTYVLNVDYKYFDILDGRDYINMSFMDEDCINTDCYQFGSKQEYFIGY